ncbi:MAG: ATP-binding cassette domain-containing protein, partial [Actinomycetes bacterium]
MDDGERSDEEGQRLGRFHAEGDGQQDRDGARAAEPGDKPHDEAGNDAELLKRLQIDVDVAKPLASYPLAIQQMVAIARALNISSKVLILDEPTS